MELVPALPRTYGCRNDNSYRQQLLNGDRRICCGNGCNSRSKDSSIKTKDVVIRGKAKKLRASYLAENSKFEGDLTKYMEKKKEKDVPDRVVDMLVSFLNEEHYSNTSMVDEVTLNVLASNVGCKSLVAHTLSRLKDCEIGSYMEIADVSPTIILSSKVDDGLKSWLVDILKHNKTAERMHAAGYFKDVEETHPEVLIAMDKMLGNRSKNEDEWMRVL